MNHDSNKVSYYPSGEEKNIVRILFDNPKSKKLLTKYIVPEMFKVSYI